MRLLLINANTSDFVTSKVRAAAEACAGPGTSIEAVTGTFGARVIASRTENAIAEHSAVALAAAHAPGKDGVLIAVSYDTGVRALREMLNVPVLGMTEAALHVACLTAGRVGLIVFGSRVLGLYRDVVDATGLAGKVAGWRAIDNSAPYAPGDQSEVENLIVATCEDLIARDGAEAIVLTGAVMADVPKKLQPRVAVPMVDGITTGVPMLEALVRVAPAKPRIGSYSAPSGRESVGLDPALAAALKG
ncbi:MAG: aspartate/glutamate racemase family protein [Tagaea sp.]